MNRNELKIEFTRMYRTGDYTPKQIADNLGASLATIYRWIDKHEEENPDSGNLPNLRDTHSENGNSAQTIVNSNKPLTAKEIAPLFEIDLKVWREKNITTNSWDVTTGDGVRYRNYQMKILWERLNSMVDYGSLLDDFIAKAKKYAPNKTAWASIRPSANGSCLAEFPLFDCHINKLGWADEVGEHYDTKIAIARIRDSFADLKAKISGYNVDKVLLEFGGDILHVDNLVNTTTQGTPQDTDGRVQKSFVTARDVFVEVIDDLLTIADVDIVCVSGNHDHMISFGLFETLQAWYRNCDRVNINSSPCLRKYYTYHNNLLGITHGEMSQRKIKELPMIMASEVPKEWGACQNREWRIGHLHSDKTVSYVTEEADFCMVRRMPSLASPDAWHYKNGFVGNRKGQNAYIWDKHQGVIACLESTVVAK